MAPFSPVEAGLVSVIGIATVCLAVLEATAWRARRRRRAVAERVPSVRRVHT